MIKKNRSRLRIQTSLTVKCCSRGWRWVSSIIKPPQLREQDLDLCISMLRNLHCIARFGSAKLRAISTLRNWKHKKTVSYRRCKVLCLPPNPKIRILFCNNWSKTSTKIRESYKDLYKLKKWKWQRHHLSKSKTCHLAWTTKARP